MKESRIFFLANKKNKKRYDGKFNETLLYAPSNISKYWKPDGIFNCFRCENTFGNEVFVLQLEVEYFPWETFYFKKSTSRFPQSRHSKNFLEQVKKHVAHLHKNIMKLYYFIYYIFVF